MGIPIIYIRMVEKAEGNGDGEGGFFKRVLQTDTKETDPPDGEPVEGCYTFIYIRNISR